MERTAENNMTKMHKNAAGIFVELKVDKVMRAAFRAARNRDNMTLKALAEAAAVRESLLMRFEHGQYLVRVEELEGLNNAHKLLKLESPEAGEPFEYKGAGVLPGTKMKRKKKAQEKPVTTVAKVVEEAAASSITKDGAKTVTELMLLIDLEKRGILTADATKTAMHKLVHQLGTEMK